MRVSVYGAKKSEWAALAAWVCKFDLFSTHNRWMIQVPRIYRIFRRLNSVQSFADQLENIFAPMFEATLHPEAHPEVARFLEHVSGFDSVDDESTHEAPLDWRSAQGDGDAATDAAGGGRAAGGAPRPAVPRATDWTSEANPPYAWQLYYLYANLRVLNALRRSKGLNTFQLRPHCGESGDRLHLASAYLLATGINHGIQLNNSIALQYLYMVDEVGVAVSPVSNNFLFMYLERNPFYKLFSRGLNVSLSTDDPLLFHLSDDALLEEYSIARAIWHLSITDLCEIAYNSVRQSGFDRTFKAKWIGTTPFSARETNIPRARAHFRTETLNEERAFVGEMSAGTRQERLSIMPDSPVSKGLDAIRKIAALQKQVSALQSELTDVRGGEGGESAVAKRLASGLGGGGGDDASEEKRAAGPDASLAKGD